MKTLVESLCYFKPGVAAVDVDDGRELGHIVDIAYGAAGWRVLVVTAGGELRDYGVDVVTLNRHSTKTPPTLQPHTPAST